MLTYQEGETDELPSFEVRIEGDKVVRSGETPGSDDALIANASMLWPGGVVEYKFYRTLSRCHTLIFDITHSNSSKSPAKTG